MSNHLKRRPSYAITSVDHALRIATALQLEGSLTVTEAAERLGVARSTAHRLLAMLVYRDFAVQDEDKVYRAGPVLHIAAHSRSTASRLRSAALPHLRRLVEILDESANVMVRTGNATRFVACVESTQSLRVTSREGMVFPAHRTAVGLVLLAELTDSELDALSGSEPPARGFDEPDARELRASLARVRRHGFAVNRGLSERGVVAVGVAVRNEHGVAIGGLSVAMPSVRYDRLHVPQIVALLARAARGVEADLAPGD